MQAAAHTARSRAAPVPPLCWSRRGCSCESPASQLLQPPCYSRCNGREATQRTLHFFAILPTMQELIGIADQLHLEDAQTAGLTKLCRHFAQPLQLAPADGAAVAARLGRGSLAVLLQSMIGGLRRGSFTFAASAHTYNDSFFQPFPAAGLLWQVQVERGTTNCFSGYFSIHVACTSSDACPVHVQCTIAVLSSFGPDRTIARTIRSAAPTAQGFRLGIVRFIDHDVLADKANGFVADNRFNIHVTIQLLP